MLSAYNYKVEVAVSAKPTELKQYLSVADTDAGPNLIRADRVPPEILANVNRDRRIVNLSSASKHKLHTIGVVYLWMDIGGYACRQPFVVVRRLAADVIIGCTFLDDHAESLQIRRKVLILADGTVVPIRRRAAGKPTVVPIRERVEVALLPPKTNLVHVAQRIVLPPQSETIIKVVCGRTGPVVLDPRRRLYDKRQLSLTNGFANVQANRSFAIRVANFGTRERTLAKNQVLGFANRAPDTVFQVDLPWDGFSRPSAESVCADEIILFHSEDSPVSETDGDAKRGASFRDALLELPLHSGVTTRVKEHEYPRLITLDRVDYFSWVYPSFFMS